MYPRSLISDVYKMVRTQRSNNRNIQIIRAQYNFIGTKNPFHNQGCI